VEFAELPNEDSFAWARLDYNRLPEDAHLDVRENAITLDSGTFGLGRPRWFGGNMAGIWSYRYLELESFRSIRQIASDFGPKVHPN
jgi:hypothetical protein